MPTCSWKLQREQSDGHRARSAPQRTTGARGTARVLSVSQFRCILVILLMIQYKCSAKAKHEHEHRIARSRTVVRTLSRLSLAWVKISYMCCSVFGSLGESQVSGIVLLIHIWSAFVVRIPRSAKPADRSSELT